MLAALVPARSAKRRVRARFAHPIGRLIGQRPGRSAGRGTSRHLSARTLRVARSPNRWPLDRTYLRRAAFRARGTRRSRSRSRAPGPPARPCTCPRAPCSPSRAHALRRLDPAAHARGAVAEALVRRMLEREAAAQPAAEAGDAARRNRESLVLRHPQRDRLLVRREPPRAVTCRRTARGRRTGARTRAGRPSAAPRDRRGAAAAPSRRPSHVRRCSAWYETTVREPSNATSAATGFASILRVRSTSRNAFSASRDSALRTSTWSRSSSVATRTILRNGFGGFASSAWFALTTRANSWPYAVSQITRVVPGELEARRDRTSRRARPGRRRRRPPPSGEHLPQPHEERLECEAR